MAYFALQKTHLSLKHKPIAFLDRNTVITCDQNKQCILYNVDDNQVTGKFNISFTASRLLQKNSSDTSTLFLIGHNQQKILTVARIALNDEFAVTERSLSQDQDERVSVFEGEKTMVLQHKGGLIIMHDWWGSSFTCQLDPRFINCHLGVSNEGLVAVAVGKKSLLVWEFNNEGVKKGLHSCKISQQFTLLACRIVKSGLILLGNTSNGEETKPSVLIVPLQLTETLIEVRPLENFIYSALATHYLGVMDQNMIFQTSSKLHRISLITNLHQQIDTPFYADFTVLNMSAKGDFFYNFKRCTAGCLKVWVVGGWRVISKNKCYRHLLKSVWDDIRPSFVEGILSVLGE